MSEQRVQQLLDENGLVAHTFAYEALPASIKHSLTQNVDIRFEHSYLTLVANAGSRFWQALQQSEIHVNQGSVVEQDKHPVDEYSKKLAMDLLARSSNGESGVVLYPGDYHSPLISLGELAGWSAASPLGLGLHPDYGPWFAYRALIQSSQPLIKEIGRIERSVSPCLECSAPCINACPANAVSVSASFNITSCAEHRVKPETEKPDCSSTCYARLACPIGKSHRYSDQQLAYHMQFALHAMAKWTDKG